jgi:hypothetical protein
VCKWRIGYYPVNTRKEARDATRRIEAKEAREAKGSGVRRQGKAREEAIDFAKNKR